MADREKVIKGIDICLQRFHCGEDCPYYNAGCIEQLRADALSLLKEQEPMKHGRWLKGGYVCGETEWICSVCGKTEWRTNCNRMKYCMFCGAAMDLEEVDDAKTNL